MSDPKEDLRHEEPEFAAAGSPEEPAGADEAAPRPSDATVLHGIEAPGATLDQEGIDELLGQIGASPDPGAAGTSELDLPEADPSQGLAEPVTEDQIELLKDVNVKVRVELGRGSMYLRDILRLGTGSVVELEKLAGDPLDIYVNDRLIAKGEVLVLNENFCIRVTEIFSPKEVLRLTT